LNNQSSLSPVNSASSPHDIHYNEAGQPNTEPSGNQYTNPADTPRSPRR